MAAMAANWTRRKAIGESAQSYVSADGLAEHERLKRRSFGGSWKSTDRASEACTHFQGQTGPCERPHWKRPFRPKQIVSNKQTERMSQ